MEEINKAKKIKKSIDEIRAIKKEKMNKLKQEIKALDLVEKKKKIDPIIKKIKFLNDDNLEKVLNFINTLKNN